MLWLRSVFLGIMHLPFFDGDAPSLAHPVGCVLPRGFAVPPPSRYRHREVAGAQQEYISDLCVVREFWRHNSISWYLYAINMPLSDMLRKR